MLRTSAETREHVLQVAHELFYWHGIRATGVDKVAAAAGVAPTTLYRLFANKDELIAAYVERADELTRSWFTAAVDAAGPGPRAKILAVFDALAEHIQPDRCRGCTFMMTLAEFPDRKLPAHRHAVMAKTWVRERIGELTAELARTSPIADPAVMADQLVLVIEGVNASSQALGIHGPARQARALAEAILPPA
ncbi:TetR/AcrR family transcriptional regulator [Saccharothrix hoggarensis]|uniref:TetR/AcrR family transcriptional regulator n=1 Tax=Saccharothrix hoggarensis TaxID=913853 RepID=A0ABW3R354_9PSEU